MIDSSEACFDQDEEYDAVKEEAAYLPSHPVPTGKAESNAAA
jgi:hypothetical protein